MLTYKRDRKLTEEDKLPGLMYLHQLLALVATRSVIALKPKKVLKCSTVLEFIGAPT